MENQMEQLNNMHMQIKTILNNQNAIMDKLNIERWKQIDGYNYSVSTFGNVRNDRTGRILKLGIDGRGYYNIILYNARKRNTINVHRLVAIAFIDNLHNKLCVDHINNCITNNNLNNLRWVTIKENQQNRSININNTSGIKGIYFNKKANKWHVQIRIDGKLKHVGYFESLNDAKIARQKAAKHYFGEYINNCEL
jgi:hypothetical protein